MSDNSRKPGTKIIATLGPGSRDKSVIEGLLKAGVDCVRLNFSHGTRAEHQHAVDTVREAADRLDLPVAIMGDLCGPKIRLKAFENGGIDLAEGDEIDIVREEVVGNKERMSTNHPELLDEIEVNDRLLIDDGNVRLRAIKKSGDRLRCRCEVGGRVSDHKGVNLPDSSLSVEAITDKDRDDLAWSVEVGLEFIALSFVRHVSDVEKLRGMLREYNHPAHIVSKIETRRAMSNLDAIIEASDVVLVARGDLGVEMEVHTLPQTQKRIIRQSRRFDKPVIVATQMLQSMVESPVPTRAEVSDVANSVYDGADALLLSAETAVGKYPVQAIEMLNKITLDAEAYDRLDPLHAPARGDEFGVTAAVARSLCKVADDVDAKAVVVWTEGGNTARLVSKHRLDRPVVAMTSCGMTRRRLALYYGVTPVCGDRPQHAEDHVDQVERVVRERGLAADGDLVVLGFGPGSLAKGETGSITIHTVGKTG